VKFDKIVSQKRGYKQNQLMGKRQRKVEIQGGDFGEGQNRQAYMNIVFDIDVKKLTDPYHWTKVSVNC
jgi:hypothetical protein